MKLLQLLQNHFPAASEAETTWLKDVYTFMKERVCPASHGPALFVRESVGSQVEDVSEDSNLQVDEHAFDLTLSMVKKVQELRCSTNAVLLNYRLVSATELLSQQHLACFSNLTWSTNQERAFAKGAKVHQPNQQALPRVNLLLVGWLRTEVNGDWMLTDGGGNVRCECLSPSPLWRYLPVFLPHWNYIPATSKDATDGCLELVASPVLLTDCPSNVTFSAPSSWFESHRAIGVREASEILSNRPRGQQMSVFGKVSSISSLLVIAGTSFFCFSLTDDTKTLSVIVKESSKLWWSQCVFVGDNICVTAQRVCALRVWGNKSLLCVTHRSEVIYDHMQEHTRVSHDTQTEPQSDPAVSLMSTMEQDPESGKHVVQSALRVKQSRLISYQGTVTGVVSDGAGLYVIDKEVGLCLAYQPSLRRKLRCGDVVEIHNVHFLYCPCPDFPPTMLCTCLRSTLRIKTFSRVMGSSNDCSCPSDGVLPKLLLEKNIGVSEYLWACHLSSQLRCSLVPNLIKEQHCVCRLSWKLMEYLLSRGQQKKRDIYSEMLDQPHTCLLNQYHVDHAVHQCISVSKLTESLQSECWSSLCLKSQLNSARSSLAEGGSSLSRIQVNCALSWSHKILTSDVRTGSHHEGALGQRPLLVIGILELPSQAGAHTLRLRDGTGSIACVLTDGEEDHRAISNTAWIGCLVCVLQFNMVMERFLQSDFPSEQHLEQDMFIKDKHCSVYLQFSLEHVYILSPSVAMVTHLQQENIDAKTKGLKEQELENFQPVAKTMTCHSLVMRVDQKEGVAWKNVREASQEEGAGLTLCFSVRVTVLGPVTGWEQDPKNCQMTEREVGLKEKLTLVCSGVSSCWFPLLHPGCYYRLVVKNKQTSLTEVSNSTLHVRPDWRFHTVTPALLCDLPQNSSSPMLTVCEVLDSSSELVCFQGLVSERIRLNDTQVDKGQTYSGVRLTVFDESGKSLRVYLDLTRTPYPPGLLPGNTLLFSGFHRRLSKSGCVYCSYLPTSSITVVKVGNKSSAQPPPAPLVLIGQWAVQKYQHGAVGRIKGHVACCLSLLLQWSCSTCEEICTMGSCNCQCLMASASFNSKAKLVIEDGTGEASVWFSGDHVQSVLGLSDVQWEGLQRALRARGHIKVLPCGRNMVSTKGDALLNYLVWLCSSQVMCRTLTLTCRKFSNNTSRQDETKLFSRGAQNFTTRMNPPPQLACVHLHEVT